MTLSLAYRGFNYVSYYNGGYKDADSLADLAQTGANSAALDLQYGINVNNSTAYIDANYTDSLSTLGNTIAEAVNLGLSVMVKPIIDFLDPAKIGPNDVGDWRAYFNPANPAAFFASYKTMIVAQAQVAQAHGAASLSIGTELDQLTGPAYLSYWTDIISAVRAAFPSGQLTYSAIWDDAISPWQGHNGLTAGTGNLATQVSFWSQLDYVGLDVYPAISDAANPTLADLIAGWIQVPIDAETKSVTGNQSLISYFEGVAAQIGKPLLFTEIGYESATDAALEPAGSSTHVFDPQLQADLYAAFFDAWRQAGDGSLKGVYFWNWDPNTAEVGPTNGANFSPQGLPAEDVVKANFATQFKVPTDFDGDAHSDILWRNDNGSVALWTINGTSIQSTNFVAQGSNDWHIAGTGDFDGDGHSDILWRNDNGSVALWTMNGAAIKSLTVVAQGSNAWHIAGTGDFDGDSHGDILWRNDNGTVALWTMNGASIQSETIVAPGSNDWHIAGTGDFNADGHSDILWRNDNGAVALWTMNGAAIQSSTVVAQGSNAWHIAGTGDFNGDHHSDILWRNDNGAVALWTMNGAAILSEAVVAQGSNDWHIAAVGDYNGDGKADILWHNDNGAVAEWLMDGSNILSNAMVSAAGSDWHIVA